MRPRPGYVYDVLDRTGRLIYIGSTRDVFARIEQHYRESWWADQTDRVRARVYPHHEVLTVERHRIRTERPRWNLAHLPPRREWTAEQYVDWLIARERRAAFERAHRALPPSQPALDRQVQIVRAEFERRFGYVAPVVLNPYEPAA